MARNKHNDHNDEHAHSKAADEEVEAEDQVAEETEEEADKDTEVEETSDEASTEADAETEAEEKPKKDSGGNKFAQCWQWVLSHKLITIPVAVIVLLGVLAAVPFTRYALAGMLLKQSYPVVVIDAETQKPVTSATVTLAGVEATTDGRGQATLKARVGNGTLMVTKKYYKNASETVLVPLGKPGSAHKVSLQATGRVVPISIVNKVSGKAVAGVAIKSDGAEATTDKDGKAILVLPPAKKQAEATLSGEGYINNKVTVTVTGDEVAANTFTVVPAGKIYFLSNASGKLDMVKSNLDGSERQTVLPGTGKEDKYNTVLLASRDWKYIALVSKRDGGEYAKLFLIEAGSDKVTTMDEGKAEFAMIGWSGDRLVYQVNRANVDYWQTKRVALKSFSAATKKITVLDENGGSGAQGDYAVEDFGTFVLLGQDILYSKSIQGSSTYTSHLNGKQATFNTIRADGSQKKAIKSYPRQGSSSYIPLELRTAEFGELYLRYQADDQGNQKFDEYEDGKVTAATDYDDNDFYNSNYSVYSVSPSGEKTLWSDFRDGKYVIFVGDAKGENGTQIGASEDYTVYGWHGDNYVLLTRKNSEMRILPVSGIDGNLEKSLKVTDYYKPNYYNRGYGYGGYGG